MIRKFLIPTRDFRKLHALSTFLKSALISIKTKYCISWTIGLYLFLAMNNIHYQHVTKPQLTSDVEVYHVCEQKDLIVNFSALWASKRNATYTTMHAKLDYMIPWLLQYVDDTCNMVKQLTVNIHLWWLKVCKTWLTEYIKLVAAMGQF